jgi:hypothetical protein
LLGRQRFASLAGEDTDIGRLAQERINTLEIAPERQHGLLDRLPEPFSSAPEYTLFLREQVACHHGLVLHKFVERLVRVRSRDETRLKHGIRRHIAQFRKNSRCDLSDVHAVRVADDFGLIYAAARLAQRWGYLPAEWDVGPQLLVCYRDFHTPRVPLMSFDQELRDLVQAPDALHIGHNQPDPDTETLANADIIVVHRSTHLELIIRPTAIEGRIRNWRQRVNDPQVIARAHRETGKTGQGGQHKQWRRKIDGTQRVYCFRMPLEWFKRSS